MAEAESGVGQGLHELRCGQQPLPGEPAEAALLNGHLLAVQPLLPVAHVLEELREGHVGRDSLWGNKHRADPLTAHPHHVPIFPEFSAHSRAVLSLGPGSWGVPTVTSAPAMETRSSHACASNLILLTVRPLHKPLSLPAPLLFLQPKTFPFKMLAKPLPCFL